MRRYGSGLVVALITGGLLILTLVTLWQARNSSASAIRRDELAIDVTNVQVELIDLLHALMLERAQAELETPASSAVGDARDAVDEAMADLRTSWNEAEPALMSATAVESLFEQMDELNAVRVGGSERMTESYSIFLTNLSAEVKDLNALLITADTFDNRRSVTVLVDALIAMGQRRRLVAGLLNRDGDREADRQALELANEEFESAIEQYVELMPDGRLDRADLIDSESEAVIDQVVTGDLDTLDIESDAWFAMATADIDRVATELDRLNASFVLTRRAQIADLERERSLQTGSLIASVFVGGGLAWGMASVGRERRRALREYEDLAAGVQRWFGPSALPEPPGLRLAARYQPASDHAKAGGDWYKVVADGDDELVCVVGDAAGHGPRAVADMARVRFTHHGLISGGVHDRMTHLDHALNGAGLMATLIEATIAPSSGAVAYHRAGHPPPLLRRSDGTVETLDDGGGPPIGVGLAADPRPAATCRLEPGDVLLLYTDGLVERPGTNLDESIAALADSFALAPDEPEAIIDALLAAASDNQRDDIAVLIVQRMA